MLEACWKHDLFRSKRWGGFFTNPFEKDGDPSNWIMISPEKSGGENSQMLETATTIRHVLGALTLSPIIMEVENGCSWKVATIWRDPFFTEPWLWEEGYVSWGMDIFNMISSLFCGILWRSIDDTSEDIQRQKSFAHLIEIHTSDFSCDTLVNSRNGNLSGHWNPISSKLIHWGLAHLCCVEWVPASLHSSMTLP